MAITDPWAIGTEYYRTAGEWLCTAGNVSGIVKAPYALANADGAVPATANAVELRGHFVALATGVGGTNIAIGIVSFNTELAGSDSNDEATGEVREPDGLNVDDIVMKIPFSILCRVTNNTPIEVTLKGVFGNSNSYATEIAVAGWWLP